MEPDLDPQAAVLLHYVRLLDQEQAFRRDMRDRLADLVRLFDARDRTSHEATVRSLLDRASQERTSRLLETLERDQP